MPLACRTPASKIDELKLEWLQHASAVIVRNNNILLIAIRINPLSKLHAATIFLPDGVPPHPNSIIPYRLW